MSADAGAALGMAFGALVTAIRKSGISEKELRNWLDIALQSYNAAQRFSDDRPA